MVRPQFWIFKKISTDISSLSITPLQTQTNYKKIYGKKVTKKCKKCKQHDQTNSCVHLFFMHRFIKILFKQRIILLINQNYSF